MSWDEPLSRCIVLKTGETVATLRQAVDVFTRHFHDTTRWAALDHAIDLLVDAASSAEQDDIKAATAQIALVLQQRGLMRT